LDCIHKDIRSHRELATCCEHALSLASPLPLLKAAEAICTKEGLHLESFLLCMNSNITFLEHHRSRLGCEPPPVGASVGAAEDDVHVAPGASGDLCGADPPARPAKKARKSKGLSSKALSSEEMHGLLFNLVANADRKKATLDTIRKDVQRELGREISAKEQKQMSAQVRGLLVEAAAAEEMLISDEMHAQATQGQADKSYAKVPLQRLARIHTITPNKVPHCLYVYVFFV
jgi:hypothetical protein